MPAKRVVFSSSASRVAEVCGNPWSGKYGSGDIILYIYHEGRLFPVCGEGWSEICRREITWNSGG